MTYWIVWNQAKTQGFITTDYQLAYEVRKSATSNCFTEDGESATVAIAFAERWVEDNCTIEQVGPDIVREPYVPTEQDKKALERSMRKLHLNSSFGNGLTPRDLMRKGPWS